MKVLFLDLETTGLNPEKDHIWQTAWVKGIEEGKTLRLIEGKEKLLRAKGKKTPKRLSFLTKELKTADLLVAHNVRFERAFLESYGLDIEVETFCTMRESTELCGIEHEFYGVKYPKLSEAVEILLGIPVDYHKLHDARYDVWLTAKLYAYLKGLQVDDSKLKWSSPLKALKLLYGLAFSPIDPYRSIRKRLKAKLNPRRFWDRLWEKLRKDDLPF
ncbi:MAG: 3'-5' exonuclease [Nitrososphaerales archaeon]